MRLEIIDDAEQKHVKSFTKNRVLIGRSKEADFCIEGGGISRQHLVIEFSNGKYFAEDLGSANGVYVNDEKMSSKSKIEIQTFFPLRIGEKTTISILNEEEDQSLGALNQKINNDFFGDKASTTKKQLRENKTVTINSSKIKEKAAKKSSPLSLFIALLFLGGGSYYAYNEFFEVAPETVTDVNQQTNQTPKKDEEPKIYKNLSYDDKNDLNKLQQIQEKELCKSIFEKKLCDKFGLKTDLRQGVFNDGKTVYLFGEMSSYNSKNSGIETTNFKEKSNEILMADLAIKLITSNEFVQEKIERIFVVDLAYDKNQNDFILCQARTNLDKVINSEDGIKNSFAKKASESSNFDEFYSAHDSLYLYWCFADKSEVP
jgi:pSer/pThr/pTyr-binding forkhead associated (FHA) protein